MAQILTRDERRWRNRNPGLAAQFDKLPAAVRANIRTANFGRGTASLVRSADAVRREAVRERSQRRRDDDRAIEYRSRDTQRRNPQWTATFRIHMTDGTTRHASVTSPRKLTRTRWLALIASQIQGTAWTSIHPGSGHPDPSTVERIELLYVLKPSK